MISMFFAANPEVLDKLSYDLRVDERVLRFKFFKQRALPAYPGTYKVSKVARLRNRNLLNVPFSPITGHFPNPAYKMLHEHLPEWNMRPGMYGMAAAVASAKMKGKVIAPPESRVPSPLLTEPTDPTLPDAVHGPSFASGGQPPSSWYASVVLHIGDVESAGRATDDHSVIPV